MAPSLQAGVLDQLALSVGANAAMPKHSLPAVHATQAMQPHSSSAYTEQLLSLVLFQSSSANGQPALPASMQPLPQQVAYPHLALHAAGPGTGHQVASELQAAHTSSAGLLSAAMQPQQQSSVLSPTLGSGGLQGSEAPHTSAFIPYQKPNAVRSSNGGCALSAVSGALMRQDSKQLHRPKPMVPVTSSQNELQDSPLSENLPR